MRRMSNLSSSGENADRADGDEIFSQADCVDTNDRFYNMQLNDTHGKQEIDEKMIAEVTGAKEVLKKPKRRGHFGDHDHGDGINIFEVLQLFRESHAQRHGESGGRLAHDPIQ